MNKTLATGGLESSELVGLAVFTCAGFGVAWVISYFGGPGASGWTMLVSSILFSLFAVCDMLDGDPVNATFDTAFNAALAIISGVAFTFAGKEHTAPAIVMFAFAAGLLILAVKSWTAKYPVSAVA